MHKSSELRLTCFCSRDFRSGLADVLFVFRAVDLAAVTHHCIMYCISYGTRAGDGGLVAGLIDREAERRRRQDG